MKKFTYKDVSQKIPEWPFYGKVIQAVICEDIAEADDWFMCFNPEYIIKGRLANNVTVEITPHES